MLGSRFLQCLLKRAGSVAASSSSRTLTGGEQKLFDVLKNNFPGANEIIVNDVSGGCGSMYQVAVECADFKGKTKVQQHRMITEVLKKEITSMHGLVIETRVPK